MLNFQNTCARIETLALSWLVSSFSVRSINPFDSCITNTFKHEGQPMRKAADVGYINVLACMAANRR